MNLDCVVSSYLGIDNFADYEQEIYIRHQENAEREIEIDDKKFPLQK